MPQPKIPQPRSSRRVVTAIPAAAGLPTPQQSLADVTLTPIPASPPVGDDWPKQGLMDWSIGDFISRQLRNYSTYRYADLLIWALFSQQAYFDTTASLAFMKEAFPTLAFTRYNLQGPGRVGWDEVYIEGNRILVFPGTEDLNELISYAGASMAPLPGQSPSILYFTGLRSVLQAYEEVIWSQYGGSFRPGEPSTFLTGHSLGGIVANYLAYRINLRVGTAPGKRGPVYAAYTYGAPAAYVETANAENFWPYHYHVRVVALGDPVPGIVQVAVASAAGLSGAPASGFFIPNHYDSRPVVLNNPVTRLELQEALARPFYLALRNAYPSIRDAATRHGSSNYVSECYRACRAERDTPAPLFANLAPWAALLASGLIPKRAS